MTKKITWLHLSDLHIGQSGQWLWPNFKSIFLSDLLRLAKEEGPIDIVIFSGDLTQKGEKSEFDDLTKELKFIWDGLRSIDQNPYLFIVPGNHDLQRPVPSDARVKLIKQWGADSDVQKEFWRGSKNQYMDIIVDAFKNFSDWHESLKQSGIPLVDCTLGILPGDNAGVININDISVGIVGLNTAYLQIGNENYEGRLALDVRQLNAVTGNSPSGWCEQNDINFLVTHHPASWLSSDAIQHYKAEIYPTGRFTAHLFGHMHEAEITTTSNGSDIGRKHYQSASLFGMEHIGNGKVVRAHGYSIGRISINDAGGDWKLWPRKALVSRSSGDRRIVPDHDGFPIVPGKEYIEESLNRVSKSSSNTVIATPTNIDLASKVEEVSQQWGDALQSTKFSLLSMVQHSDVRLVQQHSFLEGIRKNKMVWVCADWGLGHYGFISSSLARAGKDSNPVYQINLGNYTLRDDFISRFRSEVSCSFPEYCKALASIGPAILIFDECPVSAGEEKVEYIEQDVECLASMVLDFCPDIIVIMLARTSPKVHHSEIIKLEPLDEVDTKTYLSKHPAAREDLQTSQAVSEIFRHTDGIPRKIDRALKTLRVVGLAELGESVPNENLSTVNLSESIPSSLVNAVRELSESSNSDMKRAYLLLSVLSILPHGESLQRLKRVKQESPIYHYHAEELLEKDLIQVRESTSLIRSQYGNESNIKLLVAPTPVRDYLLRTVNQDDVDSLIVKAVSLYFGDDWETGSPSLKKISGNLVPDEGNLLHNPHFLITRLLRRSSTWDNHRYADCVVQLCTTYCAAILEAKNYRFTVTVCRDFIRMIPEAGFEAGVDMINIMLARSLRMIGEHEDAKELLIKLIDEPRSNSSKSSLLLNYALCLQSLGDSLASKIASEVIELSPESASAIQARGIILEMQSGVDNSKKLVKLESEARRKKFNTVANNFTLDRVARESNKSSLSDALKQVYSTAIADDDPYTAARATVKLAELTLKEGREISGEDLNRLIGAYQYFYSERFKSLFTSAHQSLWSLFQQQGDTRNLLSLFRHSSFIWRLKGDDSNEKKYAHILTSTSRYILNADMRTADQNTAYFLLRATSLLEK